MSAGPSRSGVRPEKVALGEGGANRLAGTVKETAYFGVATEFVVGTSAGDLTVFHQNVEAGGLAPAPGTPVVRVLVAGGDLRRPEWRGASVMTRLTAPRARPAWLLPASPLLSLPGLLAACGGGGGGNGGSTEANDVLNFSNWPLYIDFDEKTKRIRRSTQFTAQTGIKVNYYEDINDNSSYFAKMQGPLSQGQRIDRDIFVFTDNSRYPQLLVDKTGSSRCRRTRSRTSPT